MDDLLISSAFLYDLDETLATTACVLRSLLRSVMLWPYDSNLLHYKFFTAQFITASLVLSPAVL